MSRLVPRLSRSPQSQRLCPELARKSPLLGHATTEPAGDRRSPVKDEGLVGLTIGLIYAGTERVVVSLWNVKDDATASLMREFYQEILHIGKSPATALRQAQLKMWRSQKWQNPYSWAAFTIQGK